MAEPVRMPIESGCPDPIQYMHPTMRRNYGQWAYQPPTGKPADSNASIKGFTFASVSTINSTFERMVKRIKPSPKSSAISANITRTIKEKLLWLNQ
jgi:hypothetical protein